MTRLQLTSLTALAVAACARAAHAHTPGGVVTDLLGGFVHPFAGADHLLAMLAVGVWAARLGGRATWLVPGAFVACMAGGALLGTYGVALPAVELVVTASVVVFGLCLARRARPAAYVAAALVGTFAMFHGHAHVIEMPVGSSATEFVAGMLLATALLHVTGALAAFAVSRGQASERLVRTAGVMTAACGLLMALRFV